MPCILQILVHDWSNSLITYSFTTISIHFFFLYIYCVVMRNVPMHVDAGNESSETRSEHFLPVANATTPYWRTQLHWVDEHRSTTELPTECDVAIIGAGMSGVATAYHLCQQIGQAHLPSIVMLETRQVCSGATGRNGVGTLARSQRCQ